MRRLVLATAIVALLLAPGATLSADSEPAASNAAGTADPSPAEAEPQADKATDRGLSILTKRPFKLGWGAIFDVVSVGDGLMAVGYAATYDKSHGAAWTSKNGRKWRKSHRLPDFYFSHALPLAHDAVLAFRGSRDGCGARAWRLESTGQTVDAGRVWPNDQGCPRHPELVAVAGRPGTGMVAAYGGLGRFGPEVVTRSARGSWETVRVPGSKSVRAFPIEIVRTRSGFVLVAESKDGIKAWRSPDGLEWSRAELLPDSILDYADYAPTNTVYDVDRDTLLVLAVPDRVWRSVGSGPFESVGSLAAPVETDDAAFAGIALPDGFLVAISDDNGMRLQTSPEGATWTRAPDGADYRRAHASWIFTHGDKVILVPAAGGPVMRGSATIEAYLPEPAATTDPVTAAHEPPESDA